MSVTHTPKTTAENLRSFVEAVAAATGLAPLQPWQIRLLDAIGLKRKPLPVFWTEEEFRRMIESGRERHRDAMREFLRYRPESLVSGTMGRSRISDAADAAAFGLGLEGWTEREVIKGEDVILGFDPGGREFSVGVIGRHGPGGVFMIDEIHELEPVEVRADVIDGVRELGRLSIRLSADTSNLARSLKLFARRGAIAVLRARVRRLDRGPIGGAGRLMLEVLIGQAYRERARLFAEDWKAAAVGYADLQALHRDLYGEPAEVRS